MKNLYITIIALFVAVSAHSQAKYDLEFSNLKIVADKSATTSLDTVDQGINYILCSVRNNGPGDFPGGDIDFFVSTDEIKDAEDTITVTLPSIAANTVVSDVFFFSINIDDRFDTDLDSLNIIIVWPSNYSDEDKSNDEALVNFKVRKAEETSGIETLKAKSSFEFFPNPADHFVNVRLTNTVNGVLSLTDVTGKRLFETRVNTTGQAVTVPLNVDGKELANGMYFINLTSKEGREVQKLLLNR